jgi:hypothetical protein
MSALDWAHTQRLLLAGTNCTNRVLAARAERSKRLTTKGYIQWAIALSEKILADES